MNLRDRIGVDIGKRSRIEDGIAVAIEHGIRYVDLKIDVAPNAIETLTDERVAGIRDILRGERHPCRHPHHVRRQRRRGCAACPRRRRPLSARPPRSLQEARRRMDGRACRLPLHLRREMRMEAGLERLKWLSDHAERLGVDLLLENMNWEPDDAEVHYLAHNVEETLFYFDALKSPRSALGLHRQPCASRPGGDRRLRRRASTSTAATRCGSPIAGGTARRST